MYSTIKKGSLILILYCKYASILWTGIYWNDFNFTKCLNYMNTKMSNKIHGLLLYTGYDSNLHNTTNFIQKKPSVTDWLQWSLFTISWVERKRKHNNNNNNLCLLHMYLWYIYSKRVQRGFTFFSFLICF